MPPQPDSEQVWEAGAGRSALLCRSSCLTSRVTQRPVRRTIGPTQESKRKKPAGLVRLLRGGSCQEEEGIPRRPVSRSHLVPAPPLALDLGPGASLLRPKTPIARCAHFVFDSLSHRVFNFCLRFLLCFPPASRSAQQAEPGEAITSPE